LFRMPPARNSHCAEGFDGAFAEVRFASKRDFNLAGRHANIERKRVLSDQIRHYVARHYKRYHKRQEPALEHWRLCRQARSSFWATPVYGKTATPHP
jgi:hypothetical protein